MKLTGRQSANVVDRRAETAKAVLAQTLQYNKAHPGIAGLNQKLDELHAGQVQTGMREGGPGASWLGPENKSLPDFGTEPPRRPRSLISQPPTPDPQRALAREQIARAFQAAGYKPQGPI